MQIYRLNIWSDRGRIERDIEGDRHDALERIHAAGMLAAGLQDGRRTADMAKRPGPLAWMERSQTINQQTAARLREAQGHLKEAWLLLSHAGAREAVAHVRKGLRLSRTVRRP